MNEHHFRNNNNVTFDTFPHVYASVASKHWLWKSKWLFELSNRKQSNFIEILNEISQHAASNAYKKGLYCDFHMQAEIICTFCTCWNIKNDL